MAGSTAAARSAASSGGIASAATYRESPKRSPGVLPVGPMMRCEEAVCALGALRDDAAYVDLSTGLEQRVAALGDHYSPILRTLMTR